MSSSFNKIQNPKLQRLTYSWFILVLMLAPSLVSAQKFIQWQTSNIQLLRGSDYELSDPDASIVTFEYANQWIYGDFFMFVDGARFDDGEKSAYGEISPRFSLSKMTGREFSAGLVSDMYLATTLEKGEQGLETYLVGFGIDLDIEGFTFFNANMYVRHNPDLDDDTWQITFAWQYPFSMGNTQWVTEGFADFAGEADPGYESNQYIVPRILLNISDVTGAKAETLWLGFEYSYWTNKYGVDGIDERALQLQIKWIFL